MSSNQQLQSFADEGDPDCAAAIQENILVVQRMEERILLLKGEVEGRGFKWVDDETKPESADLNGHAAVEEAMGASSITNGGPGRRPSGGRLGDEELARRLREQMQEDDDYEVQEGVHL